MVKNNWDNSLSTTQISTSISQNLSDYEAARTSFFTFIVNADQLTNLLKPDYTGDPADATAADYYKPEVAFDTLRLNVIKCPVPHFELATHEYRRGNDVVKFAGVPTFNSGSITVEDVVGKDTKSLLLAWQYLAYNPHTRKGGRMKDYKKSCTLCEYTQDYELVRTWHLEGCFITKITEEDFDRENDGKRQLTVDFVYDRATVERNEDFE